MFLLIPIMRSFSLPYAARRHTPATRRPLWQYVVLLSLLLVGLGLVGCAPRRELMVFAGAASKPALEETGKTFEEETGVKVRFIFGGSGTVLSQIKMSRRGDLYIPGSPDYMVIAERDGVVEPSSIKIMAYLLPAILVQKGNPQDIRTLADLAKPGLRVAIGNPESVCVGLYAYELLEHNGLLEGVRRSGTVVTYAESCEKTATLLALKKVDAVIGWDVFAAWHPDAIDRVNLSPGQIPRIAYIPGAIATFTQDRGNAQRFLEFLASPQGQQIFGKWGYLGTEAEARKFAPRAGIGGEYKLPADYRPLVGQ